MAGRDGSLSFDLPATLPFRLFAPFFLPEPLETPPTATPHKVRDFLNHWTDDVPASCGWHPEEIHANDDDSENSLSVQQGRGRGRPETSSPRNQVGLTIT